MRTIRQFHRKFNYTSKPDSRVKCEHSLAHTLRIAPPTGEKKVDAWEWNTALEINNLILIDGKVSQLNDWSPDDRLELLYQIAPQPKIHNQSGLQEQQRKYKLKLKKAIASEQANGNNQAAVFLQQIFDSKNFVPYSKLAQFSELPMQRKEQRINMLKKYLNAHNQLRDRPCANNVYLQEGIFKIPHQWFVSQKELTLEEYMRFAEKFLKNYFPEYPILAIVGHDDERSPEQKTGHHSHYFISGRNAETGMYDLHKRQIEVVNQFIKLNYPKAERLPDNGKMTRKQSKVFGEYFQKMVLDYSNEHLFHEKELHVELSPEAERRSEKRKQMDREAKLPKSERSYNFHSYQLELLQDKIVRAKTHLETFEDAGNAAQLRLMELNANVTTQQNELTQLHESNIQLKAELTTLKQEKSQLLALTQELTAEVSKTLVTVFRQVVLALNAKDKNLDQKLKSYLTRISESALQLPPALSKMMQEEVTRLERPKEKQGIHYD